LALISAIRRLFRRRPLDWRSGAGRPAAARSFAVDVIIPVYGAPEALGACLASVGSETDLSRHRLVLVVDGPQESAVDSLVDGFAGAWPGRVRVLRNETRRGFASSVNRGMGESATDVVLLNSDTVVTSGWLEKLVDAAYSSGDIGTVTPLSNDGTLCSVPRPFEANLLPAGFVPASFSVLVERCSVRSYPRLPTGVGVCLYIRRALLDDIGLFDAGRFGLGYGEENDFCLRALARGWLHVADDATFVYHAGHASFGRSRAGLQRSARAALHRRHPRYMATIAELMRVDPLSDSRARIARALGAVGAPAAGPSGPRRHVVHLVHGWPPFQQAGTELYASWLVKRQLRSHGVAVYARFADPARDHAEAVELLDGGVRVRLVTNNFTLRDPRRRNALSDRSLERDFARFLAAERPDLLHVHHLAGHAFSLVKVARRLGVPIVLQLQDWWFLCARVNLFDRDGNRCTGPAAGKCARCATLTRIPPSAVTNRIVHALRRRAAREAIGACDAFVAGSRSIRDDYVRGGAIPAAKPVHVIPYGVDVAARPGPRPPTRRPLRFGTVGSVLPHKGIHTAVEAMRGLDPGDATLHVWGSVAGSPEYVAELKRRAKGVPVVFEGTFREEEKPRVFTSLDVLLVPSIGMESFGLAPREAMTFGVPVIATEGGALSEMFAPGDGGDFFPAGDAAALSRILRRVVEDPGLVDRWSARLPTPKRTDVHAAEIGHVYDAVLAARGLPEVR
jgi:glycosyltransferase involved in cell wall biosynthesis/GT2 family glycosyltransferase